MFIQSLLFITVSALAALGLLLLASRTWRLERRLAVVRSETAAAERQARVERAERLATERDLVRQEEWSDVLFNSAQDMILVHGVTAGGLPGSFVRVNDAACTALGYPRERLLTMTPLDIEDAPVATSILGYTRAELAVMTDAEIMGRQNITSTARHLMARIMDDGRAIYERVYVARDGGRIPVEVIARRVEMENRPTVLCTAHDITARRRVQQALRDSEQRFQDFFAHSPIGVAMYDVERRLINVNSACLRIFGSPGLAEFSSFNLFDNPSMPPEARPTLARGENAAYEQCLDFDEIRQQGSVVTSRGGKAYLDVKIHNMGLDTEFRPTGFLAQVQDVTRRREAEMALLQSERQLRQAQKMEAIGTLAGGIAHDFNNILTPIMGYTEMVLHMGTQANDESQEFLGEVLKASHRAKDLVNQILTFSRHSEKEGHPIQISSIIKEVIKQLRATLPPNIELIQNLKTPRDVVVADPTQIHQVLMNLCTNAAHSMRDRGGTLDIRLGEFTQKERAGGGMPQLAAGQYLRLSVRDTGHGMSQPTMDRIFEPFFTTKPSGEGTGMGLAMVHGIVTSLKGAITVESRPGEGSTFHVLLPAAARIEIRQEETLPPIGPGSACVMFVDDEKDIVTMESRMLTSLGFHPVVAHSAEDALRLFTADPKRFDIVITDQIMPGMSGMELARELIVIRPDLPIILCTGFSEAISPQCLSDVGIRECLLKPVTMRVLTETIQNVLSGKP